MSIQGGLRFPEYTDLALSWVSAKAEYQAVREKAGNEPTWYCTACLADGVASWCYNPLWVPWSLWTNPLPSTHHHLQWCKNSQCLQAGSHFLHRDSKLDFELQKYKLVIRSTSMVTAPTGDGLCSVPTFPQSLMQGPDPAVTHIRLYPQRQWSSYSKPRRAPVPDVCIPGLLQNGCFGFKAHWFSQLGLETPVIPQIGV